VLSKTVIGEWLQYCYILLAPLPVEQKIRTESETRQSTILLANTTHFDEMRPKKTIKFHTSKRSHWLTF